VSGSFTANPHPLLEARGDLIPFGQGRYGFGPRLLELIEFFDDQFFKQADQFNAIPCQFPALIGGDIMLRLKYLKSFPHSLTFVAHLREDLVAIQDFARSAHWDGKHLVSEPQVMDGIQCLLAPNVCFHCYGWLRDSCQQEPKTYTAVGKSFRYESGNLQGLERLWDFTMREWIFVGPQAYVLEQRDKAMEETVKLLNEWQLGYEIRSATDAVFVDEYAKAVFQLAFDLKYEIQVSLPYKASTLAVGSLNFHRDFFGRCMNITTADGEVANMGCAAFGLERLALSFLAQHGLDARNWPASVADIVKTW
jgi:seryl-tRNA synthetase